MSDEELIEEEKWIVLQALKCLHNLKYIADLAVINTQNQELLKVLIEEVVKIREALHDKKDN